MPQCVHCAPLAAPLPQVPLRPFCVYACPEFPQRPKHSCRQRRAFLEQGGWNFYTSEQPLRNWADSARLLLPPPPTNMTQLQAKRRLEMLQMRANLAKGRGGAGAGAGVVAPQRAAGSPGAAPPRSPPPPAPAEPLPELAADPLERAGLCPDVVNAIMLREPISHVQSAISEAILTYVRYIQHHREFANFMLPKDMDWAREAAPALMENYQVGGRRLRRRRRRRGMVAWGACGPAGAQARRRQILLVPIVRRLTRAAIRTGRRCARCWAATTSAPSLATSRSGTWSTPRPRCRSTTPSWCWGRSRWTMR
jgi:hypothetical protein